MQTKEYPPFARIKDVTQATGLCRTVVYDLIKNSDFPKPGKVGSASIWRMEEVFAWMENRLAGKGLCPMKEAPVPKKNEAYNAPGIVNEIRGAL